ncbi:MAG: M48 family metallopeptidase [Pseudomonadota bacterium]
MESVTPTLAASYFDGTSARAHPVQLQLVGGVLHISGEGIHLQVPKQAVQWPERTRHGRRVAHFANGGLVQSADSAAWDAWCAASGLTESLVVKMQQSWRWVAGSVLVLLALVVTVQAWGLPVLARAVVAVTPLTVDAAIGEATLQAIDQHLMQPSQLPVAEQNRLRASFAHNLAALPPGSLPPWKLEFRKSRIGPNALALPGGTLMLTDELVELVAHDDKVITAVLTHELGHVQHRHGLRMLVQASVLGGLGALVLGDFSTLLAAVPVFLGQAHYSREAEREADAHAVLLLKAAAISPAVMVTLFDKLELLRREKVKERTFDTSTKQEKTADAWLGAAFSSHPADAERIRFFQQAAQ